MRRFTFLLRGFGAAGAAANARAELDAAHHQTLQAALVARRVHTRLALADISPASVVGHRAA